MPALITLPVMAILIALIGGIYPKDIIEYVIGQGSIKLYNAYTIAMMGSMLSVVLQKTGVAESMIKKGAELSGDNPWVIAVITLILITFLFSILGGLGAIIMVATIVLPIMSSVGIGPMTVVGIFLFGLSIGGILNVGNWAVYISVIGLQAWQVKQFAMIIFCISMVIAIVYITIQLYRDGQNINIKRISLVTFAVSLLTILSVLGYNACSVQMQNIIGNIFSTIGLAATWVIACGIGILFLIVLIRIYLKKNESSNEVHWSAYFSPVIPLFLILLFNLNFIASFVLGIFYAFLSTYKKGRLNLLIRCVFEGGAVVMPAIVLMFGIGMLLIAIMGPGVEVKSYQGGWPVLNLLKPLLQNIVPHNAISYVLIFTFTAPLALYRGPLNVWGMGYGIAAVFLASGLNPGAIMGLLLSVGQVQGISDPTNTHNVWLANEMQIDVQKILKNTIPYTWIIAFLGLIIASVIYL
ncbi:MAG: citrate transporter [Bacteroidota bacterium]|nr:citrate transporter [Bacteroidota bacterium]